MKWGNAPSSKSPQRSSLRHGTLTCHKTIFLANASSFIIGYSLFDIGYSPEKEPETNIQYPARNVQ